MATLTGKIVADFTTSLAAALAVGATSGTLQSATDDDGVALPSGRYFFTIDGSNSSKEHISCSLSGTALTSIKSVSRQGVETSGTVRAHRLGATVTITDFAHILQINNLVNGTTDLDSSDPLKYDGTATISDNNALATKAYVDGVAIAGSPDSSTSVKGIGRVSVAPASAATPIFVGDNDPRVPTQDENDALVGTSGTPSTSNKFVTNDDTAEAATASKVARRKSTGDVTVPTTPTATTDAASKAYVDSGFSITVPLGESFTGATTPQPAFIVNDLWQPFTNSGFIDVGRATTNNERIACKFTPRENVTSTTIYATIAKVGAPADNLTIEIQSDSAGSPSNTPITNGTSNNVAGSGLSTTDSTYQTFTFASAFSLTADTPYWVVFKRTGAADSTNYYLVTGTQSSSDYASFVGKLYTASGAAWTASGMPCFEILPATGGSMSLWQSDANSTPSMTNQFMGFCTTTGSAGVNGTFISSGSVPGFSSLLNFTDYFVSTTKGAISLTAAGQNVGTCISATQIRLKPNKTGIPLDMGTTSATFGAYSTKQAVIKIPFDGFFVTAANGSIDGFSCTTADTSAMSANAKTYYMDIAAGDGDSLVVPVRKGQFLKQTVTTGSLVGSFLIPQF